jgi:hypothetical protein
MLVRVTGTAYFSSGEPDSVRFRVEPGTDERDRSLELAPMLGSGFALADDRWEIVAVPARPLIREQGKQARPPGPANEEFAGPEANGRNCSDH